MSKQGAALMFTLTHRWQQQLLMLSRWYENAMAQAELGHMAGSSPDCSRGSALLHRQNQR